MEVLLQKCLDELKMMQEKILAFINEEANAEENFQNLNSFINEHKFNDCRYKLKMSLHLIIKIANNHHRSSDFISKIEKILLIFKDKMKEYYSNNDIFNIFKSNKRILLFLIEQEMLKIDEYIAKMMISPKYIKAKYHQYFAPEIKPFISEKLKQPRYEDYIDKYDRDDDEETNSWFDEIFENLPDDFYEKRKIGENDSYVCELIREDAVNDFIAEINKNKFSVHSKVDILIYETNPFLIFNEDDDLTLIKYAAFYGSFKIFQYLRKNGAKLDPSLWLYAIHGKNADIIHLLKECYIEPKSYEDYRNEAIKCHHNEIVKFLQNIDFNLPLILKNYNFTYMKTENFDESLFFELCKYDYYLFIDILLNEKKIDINEII